MIAQGPESLRRLRLALSVASLANDGAIEQLGPLLHPELHVPSVPGLAPFKGYRGPDGFRRYFVEARSHGFHARADVTEAIVTVEGNVLASGDLVCTVDGESESLPAWFVYRFRDGLVSAIETYTDGKTARRGAHQPLGDASD